jgi:hypothetical protein
MSRFIDLRHPVEVGGHHVGVTDRLNLLEAACVDESIEGGEDPVQKGHHLTGSQRGGHRCETHDVSEVGQTPAKRAATLTASGLARP